MITELIITKPDIAEAVLNVQLPSYKVEAEIIDYDEIPPLKDTVETLQQCGETFYGYYAGSELAGAISIKVDDECIDIHRLVVHPKHFRQGIAQKLLDFIEGLKIKRSKIIVSTGTKNTPAVNFYLKNGFVIVKEIKVSERLSLTSLEKKQIEGDHISLRLVRESDFEAYYALLQDPETTRLTGTQRKFNRDEITDWIKKISIPTEDRVDFMIVSKDKDELLGEVVLSDIDSINRSANIRIGLRMENSGKGYGSEAMNLMLRYGFETLKLHRIELSVFAFNPRAIHVYEKLGFQREGVQRDVLYWEGEFHDMVIMSLLEDEFYSNLI